MDETVFIQNTHQKTLFKCFEWVKPFNLFQFFSPTSISKSLFLYFFIFYLNIEFLFSHGDIDPWFVVGRDYFSVYNVGQLIFIFDRLWIQFLENQHFIKFPFLETGIFLFPLHDVFDFISKRERGHFDCENVVASIQQWIIAHPSLQYFPRFLSITFHCF
jgi:hypothetical protein